MDKVNFHTHTYRCQHAKGNELDYIHKAFEMGFKKIGMSDHAPFPDEDYGLRMDIKDLPDYLGEIDKGVEIYRGRMEVYKSLEIEYLPRYEYYYDELLNKYGLDYLILGEHFYEPRRDGAYPNIFLSKGTFTYPDYAKGIAGGLASGFFTYVAHPDLFTIGDFAWDENCDRAMDIILEAAVKYNAILEYNANGLRRGIKEYPDGARYMYPHEKFWNEAAKTGLRVVVGSDAHDPELLWDEAMELSYRRLEVHKIKPYYHFR